MRIFLFVILSVWLFAHTAFAQTEIAIEAFEAGVIAAEDELYEKAAENFERARSRARFSADLPVALLAKINYNLGVCHYQLNRPTEAIQFLTAAVRLANNQYPKAQHALGLAHADLKNWRAAKTAFQVAVKQNRRDSESWFDLALIHLQENDFERAAAAFQKAVQFNSRDSAAAHNNLGVIAALAGEWTRAETEFGIALQLSDGRLAEARRNLQFCQTVNRHRELIAKLEFIGLFNQQTRGENNERQKARRDGDFKTL